MRLFTPAEWAALTPAQRTIVHARRVAYVRATQTAHERTYRGQSPTPAQRLITLGIAIHRHRNRLPDNTSPRPTRVRHG